MSSEAAIDSTARSLEVCGMSYRYRVKWNVPLESFGMAFGNNNFGALERSAMHRIKGVKDLTFCLELLRNIESCFTLNVSRNPVSENYPELEYAFVYLNKKAFILHDPSSDIFSHFNRLSFTNIAQMKRGGILTKGQTLTVHCSLLINGVCSLALFEMNYRPEGKGIVEYELAPSSSSSNMDFIDNLKTYFFDGNIPLVLEGEVESIMQEINELKLHELKPFISKRLELTLSRENVVRIMRLAHNYDFLDLQDASIRYMEKNCRQGFVKEFCKNSKNHCE